MVWIVISALMLIPIPALAAGRNLTIAFGESLPPWVLPETDNGILLDLTREILSPAGYGVKALCVPYERRIASYRQGTVDAVSDINPATMKQAGLTGYLSAVAYAYTNIAVSLKKNGFTINCIQDLAGYSILAWQGATVALGGEYADMARRNVRYRELANQETQIKMLFTGREQVIQMDRRIFAHFRNKVAQESRIDTEQPIDVFPLFGDNPCSLLFRDQEAMTAFDRGLEALKTSGRYNEIFLSYTR